MLRLPIIILACFTPNYILAAPTELANLAPPPTVFGNAPGPFMETALYQDNLLRNRKLLLEAVSVPSPMSAPIPKQSMDRNEDVSSPTPVQAELIRWFMKTRYGGAFTLNDDFTFHERHKKCCEVEYCCGKTKIYNQAGALIKKTGCCHSPDHYSSRASFNCGECSVIFGSIAGGVLIAALAVCLTAKNV
ncbi:uncharacterized protein PGTG_14673 [Puccinia graminis f. sp. tritici CRL 75-36-700-3]|uniref:Uncharacterized protein n=1 Tax=Puccinia graminis f. sp. tritici (strain CRL 75-36-700-3 / race SCCL) TaxID=418459 RepID=E3KWP0_PUCGT|nr:uncharacterized protein PGTG_14673 [Puccinia graminis f. sp. tritici CRL 75-36-700-3]EFP88707.1 hypothetical protein PGTG_14673 [Puccinia graminis f. sp. tritici CRL 75-36-700-3]